MRSKRLMTRANRTRNAAVKAEGSADYRERRREYIRAIMRVPRRTRGPLC